MQPWRFVVVRDAEVKRRIRIAAEKEEYASYHGRMSEKWLKRLAQLGTDERKPFLEAAPYLIVVFRITSVVENGESEPTYYSQESVGIAVGLLIAALHNMGLATLTHPPSPMKFLQQILGRPRSEVPFVLIPVGYPAAVVPAITRNRSTRSSRSCETDMWPVLRDRRMNLRIRRSSVRFLQVGLRVGFVGWLSRLFEKKKRAELSTTTPSICMRRSKEHIQLSDYTTP